MVLFCWNNFFSGFAQISNVAKYLTIRANLFSVVPSRGSQAGCTEIIITGAGKQKTYLVDLLYFILVHVEHFIGFNSSLVARVVFGSSVCDINSLNYTNIICTTQPHTYSGPVDVSVEFNGNFNVSLESGFEFLGIEKDTAEITDIYPKKINLIPGIQSA